MTRTSPTTAHPTRTDNGSRELVRQALERADVTEPLVFVNAWNEWAEGTHLEPDDRYGRAWLEATRGGLADGMQAIGMSHADRLEARSS